MKCPFCDKKMIKGTITGDGRTKVRFVAENEKIDALDRAFTEKGVISATKYTLTKFSISSYFCDNCQKMIIDTDIQKY